MKFPRKVFLFLVLISTFGFSNNEYLYSKVKDLEFKFQNNWDSDYSNTEYFFYGQNSLISKDKIKKDSFKIEKALFEYAKKNNLPTKECKDNKRLEIYYVKSDVLNDEKRFPEIVSDNGLLVWGLYDSGFEDKGIILLTNQGKNKTEETYAHEMYHYWYHRFCWHNVSPYDHEKSALVFETYYEEEYI